MGLDGTIKRSDGHSLGSIAGVQDVLADIFPGVAFRRTLTGLEKLEAGEARGIIFPEALREHMASVAASYEGHYTGDDFTVEFYADSTDSIEELGVVLRGATTHSESLFALLHDRHGWILTHP